MNETLLDICGIEKFFKENESWKLRYVNLTDKKEPVKKKISKKIERVSYEWQPVRSTFTVTGNTILPNSGIEFQINSGTPGGLTGTADWLHSDVIQNAFENFSRTLAQTEGGTSYFDTVYDNIKPKEKAVKPTLCLVYNDKFIYKNDKMSYNFKVDKNQYVPYTSSISQEAFLSELCYVKLKDYTQSAAIFGWGAVKKEMFESGNLFNINKVRLGYVSSKAKSTINCIEVVAPNGKNLKFLLDEVEIITPNVKELIKGYNEPINRSKEVNAKVKIIKKSKLPYGTVAKIVSNFKQGNSKYCKIVTPDKKEHLIESKKLKVIA